jgi:hypothetical protein
MVIVERQQTASDVKGAHNSLGQLYCSGNKATHSTCIKGLLFTVVFQLSPFIFSSETTASVA